MASCNLVAWSERILENIGTGISTTGSIVNWLQDHPFLLNAAFGTSYFLSGQCIEPTLTSNHSGVYEEMWYCSLYKKLAIQNLGVNQLTVKDLSEVEVEGQGRMRFVSRNENAKTLRLQANDCEANLKKLIDDLNENAGGGMYAGQILFSDRQNMVYGNNLYCSPYYSPDNTVFSNYYTSE